MTIEDRKNQATLRFQLMDLLTNCSTDAEFLKRLLWAQKYIKNALTDFTKEEIDAVSED